MERKWKFQAGVVGVMVDSWTRSDGLQLIQSHAEPDTPDGRTFCDHTHCPRAYRDLPHFVVTDFSTRHDVRRYAFEFEIVKQLAEALLLHHKQQRPIPATVAPSE